MAKSDNKFTTITIHCENSQCWNVSEPTLQLSFMHDIGALMKIG